MTLIHLNSGRRSAEARIRLGWVACAGLLAAATAAGCTPPELLEAADAGADGTGISERASFGPVAEVVRGSCAQARSCHGGSGPTNFDVRGGASATDAQVRAALEGVETLDGAAMVVPGDAESSALYLRMVETGVRQMPPAGQPQPTGQEIEAVRLWIEYGADYE